MVDILPREIELNRYTFTNDMYKIIQFEQARWLKHKTSTVSQHLPEQIIFYSLINCDAHKSL